MSLKYLNFSSNTKKKRIAFLNGNCGTSDHTRVTGQIVDIPVTDFQLSQKWNHTLSIPENLKRSIRPFMDLGITAIQNPYLKMEILAAQSVDDCENAEVIYKSLPFYGNGAGFFSEEIKKKLEPGIYISRIQNLIHHSDQDSPETDGEYNTIGYGKVTVLAPDSTGFLVTSDIDQTFLDTPLNSIPGLFETLFETPAFRIPIPGMPAFYRAIQEQPPHPLYFISASPNFYRRTLLSLFSMHGIHPSGLYLKSFVGAMDGMVKKVISSVINLDKILEGGVKHALDRSMKYLGTSIYTLVDQVAYKLVALLEHRLTQPTGIREVLIGDDIDSDYFIFTLYQFLLVSEIGDEELKNYLYQLRFQEREVFTSDSADRVADLIRKNREVHGRTNSVAHVWINSASDEKKDRIMKNTMDRLPADISAEGKLVPFQIYENSLELTLLAIDAGLIRPESFSSIWKDLEDRTVRRIHYTKETAGNLIQEFSFKNIKADDVLKYLS